MPNFPELRKEFMVEHIELGIFQGMNMKTGKLYWTKTSGIEALGLFKFGSMNDAIKFTKIVSSEDCPFKVDKRDLDILPYDYSLQVRLQARLAFQQPYFELVRANKRK